MQTPLRSRSRGEHVAGQTLASWSLSALRKTRLGRSGEAVPVTRANSRTARLVAGLVHFSLLAPA
jgi:hypothetical protein